MTINHALRPDAQAFDEIRIVTVPRYKTSGLSGDEWRISASIQFYRKGTLVHQVDGYRNVETAVGFLFAERAKAIDDGKGYFAGIPSKCDQEGCAADAIVTYRKKLDYCREGHSTDPAVLFPDRLTVRQFCEHHRVRGDASFDDADANYEQIEDQR